MFELTILAINVALPAIVTLSAIAFTLRLNRVGVDQHSKDGAKYAEFVGGVLVAAASASAIWLAVALRNQWALWHEDAWMRLPTGVAVVALAAGVTAGLKFAWLAWLIRSAAVLTAAHVVFPTGEAWEFLLPSKNIWLASMSVSTLVGWFLIDRRSSREAAVLGLGWILLLIAAAYLTSQSFLKITEPLMAVASVLGCLSLVCLRRGTPPVLATAAGPCLFALSAAVASAQFNSFIGLPDGLSWLAMATPAVAASLTHWTTGGSTPVASKTGGSKTVGSTPGASTTGGSTPGELTAGGQSQEGSLQKTLWPTLLVCLLLAVAIIGWTHGVTPSGGEEW